MCMRVQIVRKVVGTKPEPLKCLKVLSSDEPFFGVELPFDFDDVIRFEYSNEIFEYPLISDSEAFLRVDQGNNKTTYLTVEHLKNSVPMPNEKYIAVE